MNTDEQIRSFTNARVQKMLNSLNESATRASLARLRRGIGHAPGEMPALWGECLLGLPEELMGRGEASPAEWAIYIALTMFALHQQSKSEPMHRAGISLGTAARQLIGSEEDRERVARRFYPVATAPDMAAMSHYLRSLVTLFRAESISLDYVRLANDLYFYQHPKTADSVRLRWGEDFCRIKSENQNDEEGE